MTCWDFLNVLSIFRSVRSFILWIVRFTVNIYKRSTISFGVRHDNCLSKFNVQQTLEYCGEGGKD